MAVGDKYQALMEQDRGIAGGVATLGDDGILSEEQRPMANSLLLSDGQSVEDVLNGKADSTLSNLSDFNKARSNIGAASNPNLLDNWYFPSDSVIDQREEYLIAPGTDYYSDTSLTAKVGTIDAYYAATYENGTYGRFTVSGTGEGGGAYETKYYFPWSAAIRGYKGAANGKYGIDRWAYAASTGDVVLIKGDGIWIESAGVGAPYIFQKVEDEQALKGRKVTMSALITDCGGTGGAQRGYLRIRGDLGEGVTNLSYVIFNTPGVYSITCLIPEEATGITFECAAYWNNYVVFKAAKLEFGDKQTLARQDEEGDWTLVDLPPDRALELEKCRRYQRRVYFNAISADGYYQQTVRFSILDAASGMRTKPTATLFGEQLQNPSAAQAYKMGVIPGGNGGSGWQISAGTTYTVQISNNSVWVWAAVPESAFTVSGKDYTLRAGERTHVFLDANL